jgi:hypothetical protein
MSLELVCSCGKRFNVPEAHAGRRVKCPACGAVQEVAAPGTKPARGSSRTGLWVLLGVLVLVVLGAGVGVGWWLTHRGSIGPEADGPEVTPLQLIPANAQGVGSARLAELWAMPQVTGAVDAARKQDAKQEDPAALLERVTGLKPGEVERLYAVAVDTGRQGWLVARTVKPCDRGQILSRLKERGERRHEGRRYFVGKNDGQEQAIYFGGPQVVVVSTEEGMKRCLEQAAKPVAEGPQKPVIATLEGKSHVVVGLNSSSSTREQLAKSSYLSGLADIELLRLTADVGEQVDLVVGATTTDEATAKKLQKWLNGWKVKGPFALLLAGPALGLDTNMVQQATKLLESLKPEVKGKDVTLKLKTDPAGLVMGLMLAAKQLKNQ